MKGRVRFFNVSKAFGFIVGEDNKEYYVREGSVKMDGLRLLLPDWEVEFTPLDGAKEKGPLATEVKPLGLSGFETKSGYDTLPGWGVIDLMITSSGEVFVTSSGKVAVAEVIAEGLRAYRVSGRVDGFNLTLPLTTPEQAFVVLDPQKNPLLPSRGHEKGIAHGSYFLMLNEPTGEVTIFNLGRRYQPSQDGDKNWLIIERRFYHKYDFGVNAPTVREQTPLSGMQKDNDGFVAAIEAAIAYTELARGRAAVQQK